MGDTPEYRNLTARSSNELAGEELPERAAMSLINANVAAPINAAVAAERPLGQLGRVRERRPDRRHHPGQLGAFDDGRQDPAGVPLAVTPRSSTPLPVKSCRSVPRCR